MKIDKIIEYFRMGMRIKDLSIIYNTAIKPITTEGVKYKIIQKIGEDEYKRIRQKYIKYPQLQEKYAKSKRNSL